MVLDDELAPVRLGVLQAPPVVRAGRQRPLAVVLVHPAHDGVAPPPVRRRVVVGQVRVRRVAAHGGGPGAGGPGRRLGGAVAAVENRLLGLGDGGRDELGSTGSGLLRGRGCVMDPPAGG